MFLRTSDGHAYLNSELLTKLSVVDNGVTWDLKGSTVDNSDQILATGLASQAAARVARDLVVSVLRGTSAGDEFLTHYQGNILYPVQAVQRIYTFDGGGANQWQVRADGQNLVVALADQSAATVSLDSIAAAVGCLNVAELVA